MNNIKIDDKHLFQNSYITVEFSKQVNIIVGENGSGKSLLLKSMSDYDAIMISDNSIYGSLILSVINNSVLCPLFYDIANKYIPDAKKRKKLSSGEAKLLYILYSVMTNDSHGKLYTIDEPETSLSIEWQKTLIDDLVKLAPKAKFIIATHSPFIMGNYLNCCIDISEITYKRLPTNRGQ